MEIPDYVIKMLEQIAKKQEVELDVVIKEYEKEFNDPFIQDDPQFSDDTSRHHYLSGSFWSTNVTRQKVIPTTIIPIGADAIRKGKTSGMPYTSLYVLDGTGKLRRIGFNGNSCFKLKEITFWNMYKDVKLKEYQDGNDLGADDRAIFENPIAMDDFDPKELIDKLNIPKVKLIDVKNNLSKVDSSGYAITTDWKCVHGYIQYEGMKEYEEGKYGEYGKYTITEPGTMPTISSDGKVNQSGFTCWTGPTIMNYPKQSECYFLGTITKYENKQKNTTEYSMNCYCIIPIIVRRE